MEEWVVSAATDQRDRVQKEIDDSLKQQYHNICFNPEQQERLSRLTGQTLQEKQCSLRIEPAIDNKLAQKYVQYVYYKYQIEDPIHKQFRLSGQEERFASLPCTPLKQEETGRQKQRSTRSKLDQMRQSYQKDSSLILSSTQYPRNSNIPSTPSKEIGYRTKHKIRFKGQVNQDSPLQNNPEQSFYQPKEDSTLHTSLAVPQQKHSIRKPSAEIPVIFRYCPMCEQAVLEHNIPHHEEECPQVQQAYRLPLPQLELIFAQKIGKMEEELGRQLKEPQSGEKLKTLKQSVGDWLCGSGRISFECLQEQYHKLALDQYYLLLKLNWFRKLQDKILSRGRSW